MSKVSENSLVEIPIADFEVLQEKFKIDWPKHITAFTLLHTFWKRFQRNPESRNRKSVNVLCLNGDWKSDGTFIARFESNISIGTLDPTFRRLKSALKIFGYGSKMNMFMCIPISYSEMFSEVIEEIGLIAVCDISGTLVHIAKEDAEKLSFELPENFKLASLTANDAAYVKAEWTHSKDFSENTVPYLIDNNVTVGLFNSVNELVAWCGVFDFGSLAALQVDERYRRKGYGEIVTKAITKKIAIENGTDVTSGFVSGNFKSQSLVEKIGFRKIDNTRWVGVTKRV